MLTGNEGETILEVKNVTKIYPPNIIANNGISINFYKGEIHAVIGENGAGKSTLIKILCGMTRPNDGEIIFYENGSKYNIKSTKEAIKFGVRVLHQHLMLIPQLSVLENIALSMSRVGVRLDHKKIKEKIHEFSNQFNLNFDLDVKVKEITIGNRVWIELLKTLLGNLKILILDEPTSLLSAPQEVETLFNIMKNLKERGITVIFVTHKLREAIEISDRLTILRMGKKVATLKNKDLRQDDLVKLMFGEEFVVREKNERIIKRLDGPVLIVDKLFVDDDASRPVINGLSLTVNAGEILGLAGISGNGQKELAEVLVGLRKIKKGKVIILNQDITNIDSSAIRRLPIGFISDDRLNDGIIKELNIAENLILGLHRNFSRGKLIKILNYSMIKNFSENLCKKYSITYPSIYSRITELSGGNIQKVIVAREFERIPKVLICLHPTMGLDVATSQYVWGKLVELRNRGAGILLISEDLDEIFELSDRIAVIYRGVIVGCFPAEKTDPYQIGKLMIGG